MKLPNCKLIPKSKQSQLYLITFKLLGYPLLKRKEKRKKGVTFLWKFQTEKKKVKLRAFIA